jgi:asparagine N-glycosylation enzyme membrane subunit Stt3
LPAIFGTGAVPIAYLAGREIISSRAGLVASTLFALSPVLVWHSQDARAHSLAVLLSGVSFLFFVRALRQPGKSTLAAWAAFSALGLFTHYFVALLAGVEAAWLLLAFPVRRVRVAVAAVVLAAIPAGAIALAQKSQSVDASYALFAGPLSKRLVTVPAQLLVGEQPPLQLLTPFLAALLILPALWVLARGENTSERWGALIPGIVAGAGLALSVVGAVLGFDYLIPRNVLPFWVPVVLVVAIGFSASRAPRFVPLAGVALCLLWGSINVITADKPKFDREDWRGAADALGAARSARAIVVTPQTGQGPLQVYLPRTRRPKGGIRVREIDVVGLAPIVRKVGVTPTPPRPAAGPLPPPGFREVERRQARYYTIVRFEAPEPVKLDRPQVVKARLSNARPGVLLQSSADRSSTGSAATGSRYVSRSGR